MHADPTERKPLKRITNQFGEPGYHHPHGYVIVREKRSWGERTGRMHGQADHPPPMYWWEVWNHIARRRSIIEGRPEKILGYVSEKPHAKLHDFDSLRDARAWCDENPREGWVDG